MLKEWSFMWSIFSLIFHKSTSIDQHGLVVKYINIKKYNENRDKKLKFLHFITTSSVSTNIKFIFNKDLCRVLTLSDIGFLQLKKCLKHFFGKIYWL